MHDNRDSADDDLWCPLEEKQDVLAMRCVELSPIERETLTRLQRGDWIADAVVHLFESRGLVTRALGAVRLTPVGEATLEAYTCPGI